MSLYDTIDPTLLAALEESADFEDCDPEPFADTEKIAAVIHDDGHTIAYQFDAAPFFRNATDAVLHDLADAGWEADEAADNVAYALDGTEPRVTAFFLRLPPHQLNGEDNGFEVHVCESDARAWLAKHRPIVSRLITREAA